MATTTPSAALDINPKIHEYYTEPALRLGYSLIQGGVRHLGFWPRDTWWPFPVAAALRRMEERVLARLDRECLLLLLSCQNLCG